jgi:hypothetical protein
METVVINGSVYEELSFDQQSNGIFVIRVKPLPPEPKTIVQVAAECSDNPYYAKPNPRKTIQDVASELYQNRAVTRSDAVAKATEERIKEIEQRLQAMEKEVERLNSLRKIEQVYDEGKK